MNRLKFKDDIINECKACAIIFPYKAQKDSLGDDAMKGNNLPP